jgi:hypothetical protein
VFEVLYLLLDGLIDAVSRKRRRRRGRSDPARA